MSSDTLFFSINSINPVYFFMQHLEKYFVKVNIKERAYKTFNQVRVTTIHPLVDVLNEFVAKEGKVDVTSRLPAISVERVSDSDATNTLGWGISADNVDQAFIDSMKAIPSDLRIKLGYFIEDITLTKLQEILNKHKYTFSTGIGSVAFEDTLDKLSGDASDNYNVSDRQFFEAMYVINSDGIYILRDFMNDNEKERLYEIHKKLSIESVFKGTKQSTLQRNEILISVWSASSQQTNLIYEETMNILQRAKNYLIDKIKKMEINGHCDGYDMSTGRTLYGGEIVVSFINNNVNYEYPAEYLEGITDIIAYMNQKYQGDVLAQDNTSLEFRHTGQTEGF